MKARSQLSRWWRLAAAALVLAGAALATPLRGMSAAEQLEYQVKAGYLYNFAKFVEWPPPPLGDGEAFRLGILDDQEAYDIIAEALRGLSVDGHPLDVVLLHSPKEAGRCRVVFVPRSAALTPAQIRKLQPGAPVLLVGEETGFAAAGGVIGFVPRGDNLRYQVNLAAAKQAGLRLSARLAGLAEIVQGAPP